MQNNGVYKAIMSNMNKATPREVIKEAKLFIDFQKIELKKCLILSILNGFVTILNTLNLIRLSFQIKSLSDLIFGIMVAILCFVLLKQCTDNIHIYFDVKYRVNRMTKDIKECEEYFLSKEGEK